MKPFRGVVVGDLHVGSYWALAAPFGHAAADDPGFHVRKSTYSLWDKATTGKWAKPDVVFVTGDIVEGQNRKESGTDLWSTDLQQQIDNAVDLLSMWEAKKIIICYGSGYHVNLHDTGQMAEDAVGQALGAVRPANNPNAHGSYEWYVKTRGVVHHLQHHVGVSKTWQFQTTRIAQEMLYEHLHTGMSDGDADVMWRGHAHYFTHAEFFSSHGFVCPCWKGLDRWMFKQGARRLAPVIGYIGFTVEGDQFSYEKNLWKLKTVQPAGVIDVERCREKVGRVRSGKGRHGIVTTVA